jgi:L1 cell adhesion molecule like protein
MLSSATKATIEIVSLFEDKDFRLNITRAKFEELNADLFRRTMEAVEKSLRDAKMDKAQMNEIVLVGGSTRIPMVQQLLRDFFNGVEISKSVNPDEAVAFGAAVQAAILTGDISEDREGLVVADVTPLSLGIAINLGIMSFIVKRNTPIPTKNTMTYFTVQDNQTEACIEVYVGEMAYYKDNILLGYFILTGIPPARAGVSKVDVTFEIDLNNILNVTAVVKSTGKGESITITDDRSRLSKEEIERMVNDADKYRAEDQKERQRISARNALESYCNDTKSEVEVGSLKDKISEADKNTILDKCNEVLSWLDDHQRAEKKEYKSQLKTLETVCNRIILCSVENNGRPEGNNTGMQRCLLLY